MNVMNQKDITIQVQSVIYNNDKKSLERTIDYLANAVKVEVNEGHLIQRVKLKYGDASENPVFTLDELEQIRQKYRDLLEIEYVIFGFNTGSAKGHNLLAEKCESDYILILNPDIILSPRCLVELIKPFSNGRVGIVEARQTPIEHQKDYDKNTLETAWATTACAMVPTTVFNEAEGFDSDTFFLYCDDVDFSWRVRLLGYKIIYQPSAVVYHAKRIDAEGKWIPTKSEVYYSAEASLMMAYKWSNNELVENLLEQYEKMTGVQKEIAEKFKQKMRSGKLPAQIDKKHKVSKFCGWYYYAPNRYIL